MIKGNIIFMTIMYCFKNAFNTIETSAADDTLNRKGYLVIQFQNKCLATRIYIILVLRISY